ncbi:MAG: hypothetical protein FWE02_06715 [Defluviitaleaceae bacterium]|nr:hypothetical protein [Defluviitaleaceae bacterium]
MRYFIIEKDPIYITSPVITGWRNQFNKVEEIKDRSVFHIKSNKETVFTDIISSPFLLFSDEVFKIIRQYERTIKSKIIALVDLENSTNAIYHLPINIEIIENTKDIKDKAIFYVENEEKTKIIINLDLAESILRRNLKGFEFKQWGE